MELIDCDETNSKNLYAIFEPLSKLLKNNFPEFQVRISNNFIVDSYNLSSYEQQLFFDEYGSPDLNGRLIMPHQQNNKWIILLNKKQFNNDEYKHTFFHELIHLVDFSSFVIEKGNPFLMDDKEKEESYFWEIYYWSEFHAKRNGCMYYYITKWHDHNGTTPPPNDQYQFSKVDYQTDSLIDKLNKFLSHREVKSLKAHYSYYSFYEELMSYFGRLSIFFKKLDICKEYPKEILSKYFFNYPELIYELLIGIETYKDAFLSAAEFRNLNKKMIMHINKL